MSAVLADMERKFGSKFQAMTQLQATFLILNCIAHWHSDQMILGVVAWRQKLDQDAFDELTEIAPWSRRIKEELPKDKLLDFAEFLLTRLRG